MQFFWLLALILLATPARYSQSRPPVTTDKVSIAKRKIVINRSGPRQYLKFHPEKRTAIIYHPFISGLRDPTLLRKVRSLLSIKAIFGMSLREYRESTWLNELDYEVNYNANHILDITFTADGEGPHPDSHSRTIPVDLKLGKILKARDVFIEAKLGELAAAVDIKLKLEVTELIKTAKENIDAENIIELLGQQKFEVENLDDFSINQEGVRFLYTADFPRVYVGFEPLGGYLFPYSSLKSFIKPGSPLAQFVK
jgi:hypothetical protein